MDVITINNVPEDDTPLPIFEGKVTIQPLVTDKMSDLLGMAAVNFSPGARTKLHTHAYDQVLLGTAGKGILATETEEHVITPGMLVHFPTGEKHWHGAIKDSSFTHISVNTPGKTEILD